MNNKVPDYRENKSTGFMLAALFHFTKKTILTFYYYKQIQIVIHFILKYIHIVFHYTQMML